MKRVLLLLTMMMISVYGYSQLNANQIKKDGVTIKGNSSGQLTCDTVSKIATKYDISTAGTGTVTSVGTGWGLSGGTITTSGTITADSATLSGKYLRIADTTFMLSPYAYSSSLGSYLLKSDTAAMLSTYLLKEDTTAMLSKYLLKGDTTAMLFPYLLKNDTTAMLSYYLLKGDTTAMLSKYLLKEDTTAMLNKYLLKEDTTAMLNYYLLKGDTAAMLAPYRPLEKDRYVVADTATSTTSTSMVNVGYMNFSVNANKKYMFMFSGRAQSTSTQGGRLSVTCPTGASIEFQLFGHYGSSYTNANFVARYNSGDESITFASSTVADYFMWTVRGSIIVGATAGTVQLQMRSMNAANTFTIQKGSMVEIHEAQ